MHKMFNYLCQHYLMIIITFKTGKFTVMSSNLINATCACNYRHVLVGSKHVNIKNQLTAHKFRIIYKPPSDSDKSVHFQQTK